jgi:alpha-1,2-mannosyltransferase
MGAAQEGGTVAGTANQRDAQMKVARVILALLAGGIVVLTGVRAIDELAEAVSGSYDSLGLLDLQIYRLGGRALLDGQPLYEAAYHHDGLPFTYTPFAAVAFIPLALIGWAPAAFVAVAASIAALVRCAVVTVRSVGREGFLPLWPRWAAAGVLVVFATDIWPTTSTLEFGQINFIVMWLIVEDLLGAGRHSRWRGIGVGLATAIKLTPAVFIVFLLVSRQRRSATTAIVTFAVTVVVGAIPQPASAWTYWTSTIFDSSRVGSAAYLANQSISGVTSRVFGEGPLASLTWMCTAALITVFGLWVARRLWLSHFEAAAIVATAMVALLISPISWAHHWVWVMLVPAVLLVRRRALEPIAVKVARFAVVVLTVEVFRRRLLSMLPEGNGAEEHYDAAQNFVAAAYPLVALSVLAYLALALSLPRARTSSADGDQSLEAVPLHPPAD